MILDNLSKQVVIPALKRCSICSEQESEHEEADHEFKVDEAIAKWAGWYSLRRSSYNSRRIDERRDGFEGPAAAHKPGNHNAALCQGCAGKHAICDEFAGNVVQ